jgi:hypothetical protein
MSTTIMEAQLRDAIDRDRDLAVRGCQSVLRPSGGIAVERHTAVVGIWHWRNGGFELRLPSQDDPAIKVDTVAEAVHYTRERLCRSTGSGVP